VRQNGLYRHEHLAPWSLGSGNGPREAVFPIKFNQAFQKTPNVVLLLDMIDAASPLRLELEARDVTAEGFKLVFKTWWDMGRSRRRFRHPARCLSSFIRSGSTGDRFWTAGSRIAQGSTA
jgi:hypothetical protein